MKKYILALALLASTQAHADGFAAGAVVGIAGLTLFQNIFRPTPYPVYVPPAPVYAYPVYRQPICTTYPTYWVDVYGFQHWYNTTVCN